HRDLRRGRPLRAAERPRHPSRRPPGRRRRGVRRGVHLRRRAVVTSDLSTTTSGTPGRKVISVPSGLAGERVDAAIARMFGLSRTKAAELVGAGEVTLDGVQPAKSDRVDEGAMLEVVIPGPDATATVRP